MAEFPPLLFSATGWLLAAGAAAWAVRHALRPEPNRASPWAWWALLGLLLLCFRWPLIRLPHELYPDESQLVAGALTLRYDPVFWRSVDGNTAGPLDYYALLPAVFFPGVKAFAATRVLAAAFIWGTLVAAGETIVLLTGRSAARIAVLPVLLFAAFTTSPEYVHYSTELVPGFLLALAVLALARRSVRPTRANLWSAALLLGAVPWAKLQAAPIAAGLGLLLVVREFLAGRRGEAILAVAAAGLPTLVVLLGLAAVGRTEDMVVPYIVQNLLYTQTGRLPVTTVVQQQWHLAVVNGYLAAWWAGVAGFFLATARRAAKAPLPLRRFLLGACALLVLAAGCALAPGRPYPHYLNLLLLPLTLVLGARLATALPPDPASGQSRRVLLAFGLCALLPPMILRVCPREDPYEYYNTVATRPTAAHQELVARIRAVAAPGEPLGIWGWRSALYVETGMPQATCQAHTESLVIAGPAQSYYLRRYFARLVVTAPPVFVDATGPGNFRFQDRTHAHEVFPALRAWIDAHYTLLGDYDGTRLYVRQDRLAPSSR